MQGENAELQGGQELAAIELKDSVLGRLLRRMISGTNTLAKNSAVSSVGEVPPPHPIDSLNVQGTLVGDTLTCPGEILHHTITHNQAVSRGVHYFSEVDTNANFTQPHVISHGTSRSSFLTLPTFQNDGITNNVFYLRSYAQYPGSKPSKPTVFGGVGGAIKIKMSGLSGATLLPSTGSGTAATNGQQGGKGFGVDLHRPAPGPKRNIT